MEKIKLYKIYYSVRNNNEEIDKHIIIYAKNKDEAISVFIKYMQVDERRKNNFITYYTTTVKNSIEEGENFKNLYLEQNKILKEKEQNER